jgi:HK97 family phage major capsid protein
MPTLKELENDVAQKAATLKPLALKSKAGELTDDELSQYGVELDVFNRVAAEFQEAKLRDEAAQAVLDLDDDMNKPAGRISRTQAASNGHQKVERGDIGYRFAHSDAYVDYKNRPAGNSDRLDIGSVYAHPELDEMEQRTLIYTGATASIVLPDRQTGIYGPSILPFQVRMRDVLINARTNSNAVQFVRETGYTNAAAETAEAVSAATGAKPESALTFTVATANVATIAHWVPITRQAMDDVAQLESYVNSRLIDGLKLREDAEVLAGDGTGANITGIMSTSGIGDLNAAYWTANPLPTAGAAANKIDRIRRGRKYVAVTGLAQATFVVLHPDDLEQIDELKDTTGKYVVGDPVGYAPVPRLWGLTVVESTSMAANSFLVGDGRMAAIFDKMDATVFMADQHSDFFVRNIFVLLAEERIALAVFRPAAFAKGILS